MHIPSWNTDNQLIVSAQKVPLSTGIVYHAYSEDNIRKLRSLLQRILACIRMVSFSPYKWIVWVFSSMIIFARANVHGFNRKNFYQNVFHMFCIQLEHYVQRFILFVLLKKSSDHKKHQQMVFHCAHSQSQRTTESSSVSRSNSVLKCPLFFQFISSTLKALFFFPLPNFLVYCLYLQKGLLFLLLLILFIIRVPILLDLWQLSYKADTLTIFPPEYSGDSGLSSPSGVVTGGVGMLIIAVVT